MPESPKTKFIRSSMCKGWHDTSASEGFLHCVDVARLQFLHELGDAANESLASQGYWMVMGMEMFSRILITLSDVEKPSNEPIRQNLNFKA